MFGREKKKIEVSSGVKKVIETVGEEQYKHLKTDEEILDYLNKTKRLAQNTNHFESDFGNMMSGRKPRFKLT